MTMLLLTFDLDQGRVAIVLQALLHLAAVEAAVAASQALQVQGEVGGRAGVVEQRGAASVGLADLHPVATGNQDLRLLFVSQKAPFDPGERQHRVAAVGGGGGRRVRQRHQAGQRQVGAQHGRHRWAGGDAHLEELGLI